MSLIALRADAHSLALQEADKENETFVAWLSEKVEDSSRSEDSPMKPTTAPTPAPSAAAPITAKASSAPVVCRICEKTVPAVCITPIFFFFFFFYCDSACLNNLACSSVIDSGKATVK